MKLARQILLEPDSQSPDSWLRPRLTLRAIVSGEVNPETGFVCNIKTVDDALRKASGALAISPATLARAFDAVARNLPTNVALHRLELATECGEQASISAGALQMVSVTRRYEFAAAHRLHRADLSDAQNAELFGKCANENGHGHNYMLDVTICGTPDAQTGMLIDPQSMDAIVEEHIIDYLDHTNLNRDCKELQALNTTMENIVRMIWNRLNDRLDSAHLSKLRLYETSRSWVEYSGE